MDTPRLLPMLRAAWKTFAGLSWLQASTQQVLGTMKIASSLDAA